MILSNRRFNIAAFCSSALTIDIITKPLPGDDCKLVLLIVDDGTVEDEVERYRFLIDKLRAYLEFVGSAEFRNKHPGIGFADVLVRVLCKVPANQAMQDMQTIGPKGDSRNRLRLVFEDYDGFVDKLKLQKCSSRNASAPLSLLSQGFWNPPSNCEELVRFPGSPGTCC